jgi:hypothetical protein
VGTGFAPKTASGHYWRIAAADRSARRQSTTAAKSILPATLPQPRNAAASSGLASGQGRRKSKTRRQQTTPTRSRCCRRAGPRSAKSIGDWTRTGQTSTDSRPSESMRTATETQEADLSAATERRDLLAPSHPLYSDCAQSVPSSHGQVAEALRTCRRGSPTRSAVPSLRSTLTLPSRRRVRRRQPCRRLNRPASVHGSRLLLTQTRPASSRWKCQLWVRRRAGPAPRQLANANRSRSTLGTGTRRAAANVTREPSSLTRSLLCKGQSPLRG